ASDQGRVRPHPEAQVEVAGGAAAGTRLTFAGPSHRDVVVDAGRDGHLDCVPSLDAPLPATDRARFGDHLSLTVAGGARRPARDLTENRLHRPAHLSTPLAGPTLPRRGAGLRTGAVALRAERRSRHLDGSLGAEHRLL